VVAFGIVLLSGTAASAQEAEPTAEPVEAEVMFQENTIEACGDRLDNDRDRHVDCDDQDCEIFAICVKPAPVQPAAQPAAAPAQAQQRQTNDEYQRAYVPPGYKRADSHHMAYVKALAHLTFWPGLLITGISGGIMIARGEDRCGGMFGMCASHGLMVGGTLLVVGGVAWAIYFAMKSRRDRRAARFALAPELAPERAVLTGALSF